MDFITDIDSPYISGRRPESGKIQPPAVYYALFHKVKNCTLSFRRPYHFY
jgi:hypothetical protein